MIKKKKNLKKSKTKETEISVTKSVILKERILVGEVILAKSAKTVKVSIRRTKIHPIYLKRYDRQKNFLVHNPSLELQAGDLIEFKSSRPISKRKKWIVLKKIAGKAAKVQPQKEEETS